MISYLKRKWIVFLAGIVGNILEWYDFVLYGYFADAIGRLFFPATDHIASIMASFAVFAAGYLARPLGAVFFGHIGDKWGRKKTLPLSIMFMAVPTMLLSLLPTYSQIGIQAPIYLTLIRLLQGFSVGGAFTGSIVYTVEHSGHEHKGFLGSLPSFGAFSGILLGSFVAMIISIVLDESAVNSWGWRIPFFLGGIIALWAFMNRHLLPESASFSEIKSNHEIVGIPLKVALTDHFGTIIKTMAICLGYATYAYIPFIYTTTYLTTYMQMPFKQALASNTIGMAVLTVLIPLAGWLSDRYSRSEMLKYSLFLLVVCSYPLFWLLAHNNLYYVIAAQVLFAVATAPLQAVTPVIISDWFPTNVRFSGVSVAYNISLGVFGGTAPLVSTYLIKVSGSTLAPAYYLCISAAISLIALMYRSPLRKANY